MWSADFVSDALACGRRLRTFNIVDDFNREALHIEVDTSITSFRLVRIFEQLKRDHGLPQILRTDNGPEFLGEAFVHWARDNGMAIQYIQPEKPNQNAYIERFNRTFRKEILDPYLFLKIDDLQQAAYWWMIEYNERRPHDSLGEKTPSEVRQPAELAGRDWGGNFSRPDNVHFYSDPGNSGIPISDAQQRYNDGSADACTCQ